jgi:O-antigen/teichoic acid export membrane protein
MSDRDKPMLETGELRERIAQRAAKGALALAVAKPVKGVLTLVFIAALARLLTPADFGLVAMVAVVTRFIDVFRDAGLSVATIQREDLTEAQLSSVFWLNAAISVTLAVLLVAGSPAVAWFYDEPRLVAVTSMLAVAVLLSGVSIQHRALLRRRMRFTSIVVVELLAFAVSNCVAVAMALSDPSYWALVMRSVTEAMVLGIGLWIASGWRPGSPAVAKGVGSLMRFGVNLTGFNLLNFLSRNADNLLVGKLFGATALGVYQKSYDMMMLSTKEVMRPAGTVAISALSRLVNEPERYRRAYFRMVDKLMLVTTPFAVLMLATPDWLVDVLLGKQWGEAIPLVRFFGITALLQPLSATVGWLLTTQDRTSGLLRLGIITAGFNLALFALGSLWGVLGITIVYSVGQLVRTPLSLSYGAKAGPVRQRDIYSALLTFTAAGVAAALAIWGGRSVFPIENAYLGLCIAAVAACALSWGTLALLPRGREALRDVPQGIRLLLARKRNKSGIRPAPEPNQRGTRDV